MDGGAGGGGRGAGRWGGTAVVPAHTRLHGVRVGVGGVLSFALFFCNLLGAHDSFLGQAWAEGKGVLATSRNCEDSGQETDCTYPRHDLHRSHASNE